MLTSYTADVISVLIALHFCAVESARGGFWGGQYEDYWELISRRFTPDLRLNNCRPAACWPIDRRRRASVSAGGRHTSKMSLGCQAAGGRPRALCRRKVGRRRRQILSDGANAAPARSTPGDSWVNRISDSDGGDRPRQRRNWSLRADVRSTAESTRYRTRCPPPTMSGTIEHASLYW